MNYRYEYHPNENFVSLHVGVRLIDCDYVSSTADPTNDNDRDIYNLLRGALGVIEVTIEPYSIRVGRAKAFERDAVLDAVFALFKMWVLTHNHLDQDETFTQLPTLRTDIGRRQCLACQDEVEREMARAMRDFDTLEY